MLIFVYLETTQLVYPQQSFVHFNTTNIIFWKRDLNISYATNKSSMRSNSVLLL